MQKLIVLDDETVPLCSAWNKLIRDCQTNVSKAYRNNDFTCPCGPACDDEFYSKENILFFINNDLNDLSAFVSAFFPRKRCKLGSFIKTLISYKNLTRK